MTKRFTLLAWTLSAVVLAGVISTARADVIVTAATDYSTQATPIVDWATGAQVGVREDRDHFQTFEVGSAITISAIELAMDNAADGESVTFRLYDTNTNLGGTEDPLDISGWTELTSEAYTFDAADATASGTLARLTWTLPTNASLTTGRTYALMADDSGGQTNAFRWKYDGSIQNPYADGGAYVYSGTGSQWDEIQGLPDSGPIDLTLAIIPEPATASLLGLAGLALLRRRRLD